MLTRFNLIFLLFLFCTSLCAQKLDSLTLEKLKVEAEIYDSTGYEAVLSLGRYYYLQHDKENFRRYITKQFEYASQSQEKKKMMDVYYQDILYHQAFSGKDSVFEASQVLLNYVDGDTSRYSTICRARAYREIGRNFFYDRRNSEQAYRYYQLAKEEALKAQDKKEYSFIAKEFNTIYSSQRRYNDAVSIIDTAFVNLEKFPGKELEKEDYIKLVYARTRALHTAHFFGDSTIEVEEILTSYRNIMNYDRQNGNKVSLVSTISRIIRYGEGYFPLDTLLLLGEEAIEIETAIRGNNPNLFMLHGKNLMDAGKYQKAIETLDIALQQIRGNQFKRYGVMADIYDLQTLIYLENGNEKKAGKTYGQYKIYRDSFTIDQRKNELEKITANYELDKKETENLALKRQTETLSSRARFLTIIGVLLLSLLGIVFYFFQKTRSQAKKMEKLNETKNKIFTILAHDLKGPSLIFNNLAKKLNFLISKNDNTRLLEMAEYYEESGRKVSRIINGVLDWAIAEKDSFINNPEKIEISPILKDMINDFKFELEQKNIKVDIDVQEDANIVFDKNAFQIINRNLMHNAIKFSPVDATINIKFDEKIKSLEYIDYGKGFEPEVVNKILQMMPVKSGEGTMNEKGTGIGLVTCVKLLKENQGQIKIQSMMPIGTKIQLQFE